jgi:acyl-CoA synthetase (AMP-forming)/AMP-acid ligase II
MQPPEGSVRDWIDRRATGTPDAVSHIFADEGGLALTWNDVRSRASEIARRLAGLGIRKGESVALCLPNGSASVTALFGILYGGFRVTPLNLAAGTSAMGYALAHSEARYAFVGIGQGDLFQASKLDGGGEVEAIPVGDAFGWPSSSRGQLAEVTADDDALLMYTSGTTGRPKGVVHSQASLLAGGWTTALAHELSADDRAVCVLPIFHINGLCVTLMGPLVSGGSVIVAEKFSQSRFWNLCEDHKATWFSVVPTIISHLLHGDGLPLSDTVERLRFARSASAPLPVEVQTAFEERFSIPIVETMGLTETAAQILSNPLPPGMRKIGSPGKAVGNEACIYSDDRKCGAGESGEIAIRGPNVMRGYLNNPEETVATFTKDGWLLTGDLGHMDADGYIYVTGRRKELIIKGGENIAPREVDEALYACEHVVEAAAFARPCDTYGQTVEAAVRIADGVSITEAELIAICLDRLGKFKTPDHIHFMPELPKGPSGKIQRMKLAEIL